MKNIFFSFLSQIKNGLRAFRHFYWFLIILFLVILGGRYLWKEQEARPEFETQKQINIQTPETMKEATNSPPSEQEDEDEDEDEENTPDPESPWTLLKTALPARYFEPSVNTEKPSVALILTGLGLNKTLTDRVLTTFKGKITLVFSPHSPNLADQLQRARNLGFHTLISLPMEPTSFPNPDPGPFTLLANVDASENIKKTNAILEMASNGTDIIGEYGSYFTTSAKDLEPVLTEIKNHDRLFIDPNTTIHSQVQKTCKALNMNCPQVDLTLSILANSTTRDEFFKKIIPNAKENGIIVISVPAIPIFIDHLNEWRNTLDINGITLVTIAEIKTPEHSLDTSKKQGKIDVN